MILYKSLLDLLGQISQGDNIFILLGCYPWKTKVLLDVTAFTCITVACTASVHRSVSVWKKKEKKKKKLTIPICVLAQ